MIRASLAAVAVFAAAVSCEPPLPAPRTEAEWNSEMRGEEPAQISVDSDGDGIADQDESS